MKPVTRRLAVLLSAVFLTPAAFAQQDRVAGAIDGSQTVVLDSRVQPLALAQNGDEGLVEPSLELPWITLAFRRTPAQEAALTRLLADQQDLSSPSYHKWLGSQEFADQFGLGQSDCEKIGAWLKSQGFHIEYQARDRDFIAFSGTAGQVRSAFHTEIHRYTIAGEPHYMNASAPSVPQALADVVSSLRGLNDLRPKPGAVRGSPAGPGTPLPDMNLVDGSHALAPDDIATIYNINSLYGQGLNGSGQNIAVVGQSNINPADIREFRSFFSLPGGDPQIVPCCTVDPGETGDNNETEADLDLEWVAAVARGAHIIFVYSYSADTAAFYAIDNNLAPVISESFGNCEQDASAAGDSLTYFESMARTANAKGITWLAASGDSGAASCDPHDEPGIVASQGLAVWFPASVPEVTAVGGTEFNEGSGLYWSGGNSSTYGSALGYIPEKPWNDSSASQGLATTGGGVSAFYAKPAWQTGPGVPNDGMRDLPDVSLTASWDHDPYYTYTFNTTTGTRAWYYYGGTSASTPVLAGIVALWNQSLTAAGHGTSGNINPTLYTLALSNPGVFHDIRDPAGSAVLGNMVPCTAGSPDCANGLLGYPAGAGYDLATGLGSVNAYNLVTGLGQRNSTTTTVSANPTSILTNGQIQLTASVASVSGSGTPTGSVTFSAGATVLGTSQLSGLTASLTVNGTQLPTGIITITGAYSGDTSFAASSGAVTVTVSQPAPGVTFTASPNPVVSAGGVGMTTLTWNAPGYSQLVIRVGSPTGIPLTGTLGTSGSTATGNWVIDGMQFFLVDLTSQTPLASVTVHVGNGGTLQGTATVVTANPTSIPTTGQTQVTATVSPTSGGGTPTGSVTFSAAGTVLGTAMLSGATASLTVNGAQLSVGSNTITGAYSGDASFSASSGSVSVTVTASSGVTFTANPNPIVSSTGVGMTTLSWSAPGYSQLVIHVGSPTGPPLTGTLGSVGSTPTGNWVTDGMQFFLVDLVSQSAIASVTVHVSTGGTPPPPSGVTLTASPNPIIVPSGPLVGMTTLTWNAPGYSNLVIHVNSPAGNALTGSLASSGSTPTGNWVTNGMQFFLVDANSGTSLASVTVYVEGSSAIGIGSSMMTKSVNATNACQVPTPASTFFSGDAAAYVWFQVNGASVGDTPVVRWYGPGGTLYFTFTWQPLAFSGSGCMWAYLSIENYPPASMPGAWSVTVTWNGSQVLSMPFNIAVGTASFNIGAAMMTETAGTASGCPVPSPTNSFLTSDAAANVWFLVNGASEGDVFSANWYSPAGNLYTTSTWNPLASAGSWCFSGSLPIAGHPPASTPGNWHVNIYRNGLQQLAVPAFTISASTGAASSQTGFTLSSSPGAAGGQSQGR